MVIPVTKIIINQLQLSQRCHKLFELCLSKLLDTFLVTSDNQFGFKRKHATDSCIYTVKSVIKYYNYSAVLYVVAAIQCLQNYFYSVL